MKPLAITLFALLFLCACKKDEKEIPSTQYVFVAISSNGPDTVECYWFDDAKSSSPSDSSIFTSEEKSTVNFGYTFEKKPNENWEIGLKCKMKGGLPIGRFRVKAYINSVLYQKDSLINIQPDGYGYWSFKKP